MADSSTIAREDKSDVPERRNAGESDANGAAESRAVVASARIDWPDGLKATPEYEAAIDHLRTGEGNLFVTGRAGTGKSTLLRALGELVAEPMAIVAPTGLAAVNVGGQTIHSFFGLPPRLVGPDDIRRSRNGALMRKLKLLVIDEVSMVRSDLMWAIDQSLAARAFRRRQAHHVRRPPPATAGRAGARGR